MRGAIRFIAPLFIILLVVYLSGIPPAPQPRIPPKRLDKWRILGPGGGGAQFNLAISPLVPGLVLVTSDMSGAYITRDDGASWRMFNLLSAIRQFNFDPKVASTIYAASTGLWRSRDTGQTWQLLFPTSPSGVRITGEDTGLPVIDGQSDTGFAPVRSVAIDPEASSVLYVWVGRSIYRSIDGGIHWSLLVTLPDGGRLRYPDSANRIFVDPVSPASDRKLLIMSTTWRAAWQDGRLTVGNYGSASSGKMNSVCLSKGPVLYAASNLQRNGELSTGGLSRSADGGMSWTRIHSSQLESSSGDTEFPAIACSEENPAVVFASYRNLKLEGGKTYFGVARSGDAGRSWKLVWQENGAASPALHDAWITRTLGPDWGEAPLSLAVDPKNPETVFASDLGRTLRSYDAGKTWDAVYSRSLGDGTFTTTGLDVTSTYGVHFDPFKPGRLLLSQTDIGLFQSNDRGDTWMPAHSGIPSKWRNTTYWAEFDPDVKGRVWAAMSRLHDFPRTKMFRSVASRWLGGVSRSEDGGQHWTPSVTGMGEAVVTHLLINPRSSVASRTVFAAAMNRGVYRSSDGGHTWLLKNAGLPPAPRAWRLSRAPDGTLYVVLTRKSENEIIGTENDGMVYRSVDEAETWSRIPLPAGVNGPTSLTIDLKIPQRLYLAAWGRYTDEAGELAKDGGVYLSTDAGKSWRSVFSADQFIYDVTLDTRSGILYAAGFQASIWKSEDRGESWKRIRGFNFKAAHRVFPDPEKPDMIYVTTYGGGLWHGPAKGDSTATEDIAGPPSIRYSH